MTTYSVLAGAKTVDGSIQNWVNDARVPAASVISKAEKWIYQYLRVREMKHITTGTIAQDATTLDLSGLNFLEPRSLRRTGSNGGPIYYIDEEHYESRIYVDDSASLLVSAPTEYTILGSTLYFNNRADQAYPYRFVFIRSLDPLAAGSNETNFLTDRYPHVLEAACFYWAYSFKKDKAERDHWLQVAMELIDKANDEAGLLQGTERHENYWEE